MVGGLGGNGRWKGEVGEVRLTVEAERMMGWGYSG